MANVKGKDNFEVMPQIDGVDIVPPGGTAGQVLTKDTGTDFDYSWTDAGSGSPGGADSNIQYNNGGVFGGEANLSYDDVTKTLTLDNGGSNKAELASEYIQLSGGTTANRPGTPVNGMVRYNTTTNKVEAYENGGWINFRQEDVILARYSFFMDQVEFPVSGSDWNITAGAPGSSDSNNSSLTVRLFDDTTEEAIGMSVKVPSNATTMTVRTTTRAETGSNADVVFDLHLREIPDNAAIGAWSSSALMTVSVTADELWQLDETTDTLANWGITAGAVLQVQVSRDTAAGGDTLVGDAALLLVQLEFKAN